MDINLGVLTPNPGIKHPKNNPSRITALKKQHHKLHIEATGQGRYNKENSYGGRRKQFE